MQRRDDGRPVAALLLLFSMFAFALVFHLVTRPQNATLEARFTQGLTAYPMTAARVSRPNVIEDLRFPPPAIDRAVAGVELVALLPPAPPEPAAPLESSPLSTVPTELPGAIAPFAANSAPERGAVSRALDTTRSALRSALKKTF